MDAAKVELKRALGRLVRGLSILFWALPAAVIVDVETARTNWLGMLDGAAIVPPMMAGAVIYYALRQLHDFQKQERIWRRSIHRAEMLAVTNAGLAPFLYWWHRFPEIIFYTFWVAVLAFAFLLLMIQMNQVLQRLCAMLPDEHLREESRMFTSLNIGMFSFVLAALAMLLGLWRAHLLPRALNPMVIGENPRLLWLVLFMNLLPLALTLAILWRIKEVIFLSIFEAE